MVGVTHNRQPSQHVGEQDSVMGRILGDPKANYIDRARDIFQQKSAAGGRPGASVVMSETAVRETIKFLDSDVPSCDEHQLDDDEWARVPLAAVLDPRGAVDRFTVLERGERGFTLVPHDPGGVDRVEVVLGAGNFPVEVVVVDRRSRIDPLRDLRCFVCVRRRALTFGRHAKSSFAT